MTAMTKRQRWIGWPDWLFWLAVAAVMAVSIALVVTSCTMVTDSCRVQPTTTVSLGRVDNPVELDCT